MSNQEYTLDSLMITSKKLEQMLSEETDQLVLVDVRSFINFNQSHIQTSINLCVPKTILKRKGFNLQLIEGGACRKSDSETFKQRTNKKVVLYDQNGQETQTGGVIDKIIEALTKENKVHSVMWLEGGFESFCKQFHGSVVTIRTITETKPENKFKPTEISSAPISSSSSWNQFCASTSQTSEANDNLLIQITDYLYLGGSEASENLKELSSKGVGYVINTANELKNTFEDQGFQYLRLDLLDIPSQKICTLNSLEASFNFIEKARSNQSKVLVHCRGGRSRSATIVMAYLMKKNSWTMQEAYKYVQSRSPIVSPNLGFIGQLIQFEVQLGLKTSKASSATPKSASPSASPLHSPSLDSLTCLSHNSFSLCT